MARRRARCRFAIVASLCAVSGGMNEPNRERFVVHLALEDSNNSTEETQDETLHGGSTEHSSSSSSSETAGVQTLATFPVRHTVNVSFQGHSFKCRLPNSGTRSRERLQHAARHVAALRAAPLAGQCFEGATFLEDSSAGSHFKVCVSDNVSVEGASAKHAAENDRPLKNGGFEQEYVGESVGGGKPLRVLVQCGCSLSTPTLLPEPACRPGDAILAPRGRGRIMQSALVAADAVAEKQEGAPDVTSDEWFSVFWKNRPWLRTPWDNSSVPMQPDEERTVRRSDAVSADGRGCSTSTRSPKTSLVIVRASAPLQAAGTEALGSEGVETAQQNKLDLRVELSAVNCCGLKELRTSTPEAEASLPLAASPQVEFARLLSPLVGQCLRVLSGWWTYELCWPYRIRQLHHSIAGEVEGTGTLLGNFSEAGEQGGLALHRSAHREEGQSRHELITHLKGDSCDQTVQRWTITLPSPESDDGDISCVGGSFNPLGSKSVEGPLEHSDSNIDGCRMFGESFQGSILLVKRGNCWFHTKAVNAQAAGAIAIIVFNDQHQMVEVMEGVDELPSPMIPTVLVETAPGNRLLKMLGMHVTIAKSTPEGRELKAPIATSVVFRCSADWHQRRSVCQIKDEVDVKLPPAAGSIPGAKWPRSAVRVMKATIDEINVKDKTLQVTWLPSAEGEDEGEAELPSVIPSSAAYYDGAPCDSIGSSRIELITEPQACHTEFLVHVPELCAHPRLGPPQPRESQVIACSAHDSTKEALAKQKEEPKAERFVRKYPPPKEGWTSVIPDWEQRNWTSRLFGIHGWMKATFSIGDRVTWKDQDRDIPTGAVGTVDSYTDALKLRVVFPSGTFHMKPTEVEKFTGEEVALKPPVAEESADAPKESSEPSESNQGALTDEERRGNAARDLEESLRGELRKLGGDRKARNKKLDQIAKRLLDPSKFDELTFTTGLTHGKIVDLIVALDKDFGAPRR